MLAALALTAQAPAGWVTVRATQQAPILTGFANVQPGTPVTITALQAGVLSSLSVLPGETVQPGQTIGLLGGPQIALGLQQFERLSQILAGLRGFDHVIDQATAGGDVRIG